MKKITILLFFATISTFSQNFDKIKISELNINGKSFYQNTMSFQSEFGTPTLITTFLNEISNENWLEYRYINNSFYFDNDNLIEFLWTDNTFYFQSENIKVGENINEIEALFPFSYSKKKILNNLGFIKIEIILDNNESTDMLIIINYNKDSKNITSIHSASN